MVGEADIYQIYVRSFADGEETETGDLRDVGQAAYW